MLRFVIRKKEKSCDSAEMTRLITLDANVPELEGLLKKGGYDQYAFEHYELVGVEMLPVTKEDPTK